MNKTIKQKLKLALFALVGLLPVLGAAFSPLGVSIGSFSLPLGWGLVKSNVALAQFVRPEEVAPTVYQLLPDFPKENQYVRQDSGEVASNDTLISRLIAYHLYVKNRLPNYRLDWKFTLADYLGANEAIEAEDYPGASILRENPVEGDMAIINRLDRQQREQLIQALVRVFNPQTVNLRDGFPASPQPEVTPTTPQTPITPSTLPKPGGAELLKS